MIVEIESVDNGFIVRQKDEEGGVFVRSIDTCCSEEDYQKNTAEAVVETAYTIFEYLGHLTSKHKRYNWRFRVEDGHDIEEGE